MTGTVERRRTADDGQILSYDILTDKGYLTSRHRRYMKYLNDDNDKSDKNDNNGANTSEEIHSDEIPDKVVKRRSSRLKGAAASKVGAFVKSVSMGCEISSQKPIEAEVKLVITGRQVEVTKLVTTSEDHCDDNNCTVCFESQESSPSGSFDNIGEAIDNMETRAKLDAARERKKMRKRMYRLKKRLERKERARREAQRANLIGANLEMSGSGSSHGGSFDTLSLANGSVAGNSQSSTTNHSDVTNYTPRNKLPRNIIEVVTLMESSDSEEEIVRITRKMREREYK